MFLKFKITFLAQRNTMASCLEMENDSFLSGLVFFSMWKLNINHLFFFIRKPIYYHSIEKMSDKRIKCVHSFA